MESNEAYTVKFLPSALADLSEIVTSFAMLGSKKGAQRIRKKFVKASAQVGLFPYSCVLIPDTKLSKIGYRMIVVEDYLLFYRVFDEQHQVVFYRIISGKRNYPTLLNKLHNDLDVPE